MKEIKDDLLDLQKSLRENALNSPCRDRFAPYRGCLYKLKRPLQQYLHSRPPFCHLRRLALKTAHYQIDRLVNPKKRKTPFRKSVYLIHSHPEPHILTANQTAAVEKETVMQRGDRTEHKSCIRWLNILEQTANIFPHLQTLDAMPHKAIRHCRVIFCTGEKHVFALLTDYRVFPGNGGR